MQVVLSSRVEKVTGRGLNQWIRPLSHKLNRFIQNVESAQRAAAILHPASRTRLVIGKILQKFTCPIVPLKRISSLLP